MCIYIYIYIKFEVLYLYLYNNFSTSITKGHIENIYQKIYISKLLVGKAKKPAKADTHGNYPRQGQIWSLWR